MAGALFGRLGATLVVMLGVSTLVFLLLHLVPGDPVEAMLGESARPADLAALRAHLGLDRPLSVQYLDYLAGLTRLDLGQSLTDQRPVADMIAERFPATLQLTLAALTLAVLIALPLGVLAARHQGGPLDSAAMGFSVLGMAVPNFWLGPMLILVFSLWLGWTPVSGREGWNSLILPALTLGTGLAALLARMVRASLLEVLGEDYIRTARAKGLNESAVLWRHALRNAALPILTLLGLQLGGLLGGAVITETVFSWPGIGSLLVDAIKARDYPVVQGCVLLISLIYVGVNTLTDVLYLWIDPRIGRA
ncbi:nickel ABC transporter permease [Thiorhodovibrio frisius]|uniref:ABC-type dipeptide/oligopeptide/nickel transport system, permease component n=1 Tax=Thiorhodovibrio frisius TaxID=631362 RepID=H8Z006_9GAMM|nr:nickel ABC transporter permease [Thiorhodovibrio frisius]EIC21179.1 ABC-type dipeptide/oligopeptide/nickel transport system, permease component [Thiorhodovibrio frisius]WPL23755.1 Glutathione transport system permease protein GsiC [Thiorhodovibrio frisius]